jgi:hypothetical protein
MKENYNKNNRYELMNQFIKIHFKSYHKKDISFNDNDIGISANNDYDKNDNLLTINTRFVDELIAWEKMLLKSQIFKANI